MNYLWPLMIIFSLLAGIFSGNITETFSAGMEGAKNALMSVISFAGVMCFWSGMLEVAEKSGVSKKAQKLLSPLTKRLFPKLKKEEVALEKITQNICANMLGMGNAATPAGISAMNELDRINKSQKHPSDEMCIFTVLNTASVQLIPTTVISLLASAGAKEPFKIILPVWICSFVSLCMAVFSMKLILKITKKE